MPFPVALPDVEALLSGYLRDALTGRSEPYAAGVRVGRTLPSPRPDRAVVIRDDGGGRPGDVRGNCQVGVNVWGSTPAEAMDLGNLVSALLVASISHGPIRRASATRPMRLADESEQPRVYLTASLIVRGQGI